MGLIKLLNTLLPLIQTLTLLALVWYALETRVMRVNAVKQMRLSVMPVLRVRFEGAVGSTNRVLLMNEGNGVAAKAQLQGFNYQIGGDVYRCTFAPVHTIPQNDGAVPRISIDLKHDALAGLEVGQRVPDPNAILFEVLGRAVTSEKPLVLGLYVMDLQGNTYKSEVWITQAWLTEFLGGNINEQPETTPPILVRAFPTDL